MRTSASFTGLSLLLLAGLTAQMVFSVGVFHLPTALAQDSESGFCCLAGMKVCTPGYASLDACKQAGGRNYDQLSKDFCDNVCGLTVDDSSASSSSKSGSSSSSSSAIYYLACCDVQKEQVELGSNTEESMAAYESLANVTTGTLEMAIACVKRDSAHNLSRFWTDETPTVESIQDFAENDCKLPPQRYGASSSSTSANASRAGGSASSDDSTKRSLEGDLYCSRLVTAADLTGATPQQICPVLDPLADYDLDTKTIFMANSWTANSCSPVCLRLKTIVSCCSPRIGCYPADATVCTERNQIQTTYDTAGQSICRQLFEGGNC